MLERVTRGEATPMDLEIIASVQENIIGHCLCVLGDSMAMPVGRDGGQVPRRVRSGDRSAREPGVGDFDASPIDRPLTTGVAA